MQNTKNINWVDTAELKAVKIDKNYGKRESYTSLVLAGVLAYFVMMIITTYLVLTYGEIAIEMAKDLLYQGNFFEVASFALSGLSLIVFGFLLWFSIKGMNKTKVGIIHQVNTKDNYSINVASLVIGTIFVGLLIGFTILRIIMSYFM